MPYAKILGEDHRSNSDKQKQSKIQLAEYDAIFEENHENEEFHYWGVSTILGLPYFATFLLYRKLAKGIYHDHEDLLIEGRQLGIGVENDIDLGPIDTYKNIAFIWKVLIPTFAIICGIVIAIYVYSKIPPGESLKIISPRLLISDAAFTMVFFGLNHGFTEIAGSFSREKHMADNIDKMSDEHNYEKVLVICGDQHAPIISYLLEEKGWDQDLDPSSSRLSWAFGFIRILKLRIAKILI